MSINEEYTRLNYELLSKTGHPLFAQNFAQGFRDLEREKNDDKELER